MLASKTKWNFHENPDVLPSWMEKREDISPVTKKLLIQQGMKEEDEVDAFLSPSLRALHLPTYLSQIKEAAERVHQAIKDNEKILVFGDYDADGISSTTLLIKTLHELSANVDYYIPNRFTEGYGPNEEAFKEASKEGFSLIITVDTGIASIHEATIAKELGIDLIITDHHEIQAELPDAYAIINPKKSPEYPFKELAGVGVVLKFATYLLGYFPEQYLDLVAIGTIADLVPLTDENRVLAYYGLRKLADTNNKGLKALKKVSKIEGAVTEEDVGFLIGPRLNAVGRIKDANLAVKLLMTDDDDEALYLAKEVQMINEERQKIVSSIVKEAEEMVQLEENENIIMVAKKGWNEGVLGIVASRLVRKYDRPAFVLTIKPETSELKGSARSIPAFNMFESCMEIRDLFSKFGGHSQAAGMSFPFENLGRIKAQLNDKINQELSEADYSEVTFINQSLDLSDINEQLVNEINQLAPFGMGNKKPFFHIKAIPTDARQIGNLKKHLKLQFRENEHVLEGIGFGFGNSFDFITPNTNLSIIGELGINEWNGNRKVQLVLKDLCIDEFQVFDHRGKKNMNLSPYLEDRGKHVIISEEDIFEESEVGENIHQITYQTSKSSLHQADTLYIFDLPQTESELREMIEIIDPKNIHVCFYVKKSTYLQALPSREVFTWFYAFIFKRKKVNLNEELNNIMQMKKWSKERIIFLTKVFLELEFISLHNGVAEINKHAKKRDLSESLLYQQRMNEAEIEKTLYYSNYTQLKSWFQACREKTTNNREAMINGL